MKHKPSMLCLVCLYRNCLYTAKVNNLAIERPAPVVNINKENNNEHGVSDF